MAHRKALVESKAQVSPAPLTLEEVIDDINDGWTSDYQYASNRLIYYAKRHLGKEPRPPRLHRGTEKDQARMALLYNFVTTNQSQDTPASSQYYATQQKRFKKEFSTFSAYLKTIDSIGSLTDDDWAELIHQHAQESAKEATLLLQPPSPSSSSEHKSTPSSSSTLPTTQASSSSSTATQAPTSAAATPASRKTEYQRRQDELYETITNFREDTVTNNKGKTINYKNVKKALFGVHASFKRLGTLKETFETPSTHYDNAMKAMENTIKFLQNKITGRDYSHYLTHEITAEYQTALSKESRAYRETMWFMLLAGVALGVCSGLAFAGILGGGVIAGSVLLPFSLFCFKKACDNHGDSTIHYLRAIRNAANAG